MAPRERWHGDGRHGFWYVSSAEVLGAMGPDAAAALRALDIALDDRDPTVRRSAAAAIKRINPSGKTKEKTER